MVHGQRDRVVSRGRGNPPPFLKGKTMKYLYGSILVACVLFTLGMVGYMENLANDVSWAHVIVTILVGVVSVRTLDALAKEL